MTIKIMRPSPIQWQIRLTNVDELCFGLAQIQRQLWWGKTLTGGNIRRKRGSQEETSPPEGWWTSCCFRRQAGRLHLHHHYLQEDNREGYNRLMPEKACGLTVPVNWSVQKTSVSLTLGCDTAVLLLFFGRRGCGLFADIAHRRK